jgi:hypothetical protein
LDTNSKKTKVRQRLVLIFFAVGFLSGLMEAIVLTNWIMKIAFLICIGILIAIWGKTTS